MTWRRPALLLLLAPLLPAKALLLLMMGALLLGALPSLPLLVWLRVLLLVPVQLLPALLQVPLW
jgi:hypothetical protein